LFFEFCFLCLVTKMVAEGISDGANDKYISSAVDENSVGPVKTDEDDFKLLQARPVDEIFDQDFKNFALWMRKTYGAKYSLPVMRRMNRDLFIKLILANAASISVYVLLRTHFMPYVALWFLPMLLFNVLYVVRYMEIAHVRTHWTTNMTGSLTLDKFIDSVMISLTGMSKESYRRRHVVAHYADVGNVARMFSDVWFPFITFPALYYFRPWKLMFLVMDKKFCEKERLNRSQLFVEAIMLYIYMITVGVEIFKYHSFYLLCFHMLPLILFQACQVMSASIAHSGIDKRNSFNSNGCFDPDTLGPNDTMFKIFMWTLGIMGNWAVVNHGLHHAFTQLPLEIVNQEYKVMNHYALEHYKNVRYNRTLSHIVFKDIYSRLPPPAWYQMVIQVFVSIFAICGIGLTVVGFDVPPVLFEKIVVDYRIVTYSSFKERQKYVLAFWSKLKLEERLTLLKSPNYYFHQALKHYRRFKADVPADTIPEIDPIAPDEVMEVMGLAGPISNTQKTV